jgi:hypothetical protein
MIGKAYTNWNDCFLHSLPLCSIIGPAPVFILIVRGSSKCILATDVRSVKQQEQLNKDRFCDLLMETARTLLLICGIK